MKHHSKKIHLQHVGALVVGGVVASKINGIALPVIPEKVKPFVPVVVGILLMRTKNPTMQMAGKGMIVVGGVNALKTFVPQLGLGGPGMGDYYISEPDSMPQINGMGYPAALAGESMPGMGYPAALSGMDAGKEYNW